MGDGFVPEGQIRSQARSAWAAMEREIPEGRRPS
jgi:hypothetical protein